MSHWAAAYQHRQDEQEKPGQRTTELEGKANDCGSLEVLAAFDVRRECKNGRLELVAYWIRFSPWVAAASLCLACGSAAPEARDSTRTQPTSDIEHTETIEQPGGEARAAAELAAVPFRMIDNRIFVDVHLDGRGPYAFILDTGARNVLDLATATELGLQPEEELKESGAGEAKVSAYRTTLEALRVGEVELTKPRVLVISLAEVRDAIGFADLDGVLGLELFRNHVVTIDHGAGLVRFDRPESYSYDGPGQAIPFEFSGHIPMVRGTIEGIEASFWIDLGDRSALTLNVPFATASGLDSMSSPSLEAITGWGVGGPISAKVTRLKSLLIGELELGPVIARVPMLEGGAYMNESVSGSIGGAVLNRYDLVVDYPRQRLIFELNGRAAPGYDRSGLWLSHVDASFEVRHVVTDSPSDELGIRSGIGSSPSTVAGSASSRCPSYASASPIPSSAKCG